jgi:2-dehydro-3-deoxygluconokinase
MLGVPVNGALIASGEKEDYLQHALSTSEQLLKKFPRAKMVANTFRFDHGVAGINYYTTLYADGKLLHSTEYFSEKILDKVGSGDCFMAGLIHGLYGGRPVQDTLEFATAAAFQKLFIPSDATNQKEEEILKFIATYER